MSIPEARSVNDLPESFLAITEDRIRLSFYR